MHFWKYWEYVDQEHDRTRNIKMKIGIDEIVGWNDVIVVQLTIVLEQNNILATNMQSLLVVFRLFYQNVIVCAQQMHTLL